VLWGYAAASHPKCGSFSGAENLSRYRIITTAITGELLQQQSQEIAVDNCKSKAVSDKVRLAETAYAELCANNVDSLGEMLHQQFHGR
jgi:hypothetical protein